MFFFFNWYNYLFFSDIAEIVTNFGNHMRKKLQLQDEFERKFENFEFPEFDLDYRLGTFFTFKNFILSLVI